MAAYYNEIDSAQAARLRALIKLKMIADGEVDERSIEDIRPSELNGFTQCHFFAGIGGWSRALRLAGWPDDRPVWTGSCPCQSFSTAGQGKGFADERHLWPAWFHLIGERQPTTIFGEQVDAAIRHGWLDLVQTDLEAVGYAVGHSVIPAAGIGAPHGRHRLWFVAHANDERSQGWRRAQLPQCSDQFVTGSSSAFSGVANSKSSGHTRQSLRREGWMQTDRVTKDSSTSSMEHGESKQERLSRFARERRKTNGFWLDADWIPCRDGKWRPIEPGVFPLANGVPGRMDLLRGFGNAIVPQVAAAFIRASL